MCQYWEVSMGLDLGEDGKGRKMGQLDFDGVFYS